MADGYKIRTSGLFGIVCVAHEEWQPVHLQGSTVRTLRYSQCRDWGRFGGAREQNSRYRFLRTCFLAMLSSSHPYGLAAVFMDGSSCSVEAPQCTRKALWITKPSSDSTADVMCWGFYFSFFQQLILGQEDKLFRKKVLCLVNRHVLNPF